MPPRNPRRTVSRNTGQIEPDVDRYGPHSRESSLADYLEILALTGNLSPSTAELSDLINDNGWGRLFGDQVEIQQDLETRLGPSLATDAAQRVFQLIEERLDVLQDRYPFLLQAGRVTLKAGVNPRTCVYSALLCILLDHAFNTQASGARTAPFPEFVFEEMVHSCLQRWGLRAVNTAHLSRSGAGDFETVVKTACLQLDLIATPDSATYSAHANEEGVDTLAKLDFGDGRLGQWVLIGQSTVAASDEWRNKLNRASTYQWRRLLGSGCSPVPFLAVPHHVQREILTNLVTNQVSGGFILDRLRLAKGLSGVTSDSTLIVERVLTTPLLLP